MINERAGENYQRTERLYYSESIAVSSVVAELDGTSLNYDVAFNHIPGGRNWVIFRNKVLAGSPPDFRPKLLFSILLLWGKHAREVSGGEKMPPLRDGLARRPLCKLASPLLIFYGARNRRRRWPRAGRADIVYVATLHP